MVYVMEDGRTSFAKLASALRASGDDPHVVYCVFDLLYADGYDLTGVALRERKRVLRAVLRRGAVLRAHQVRRPCCGLR